MEKRKELRGSTGSLKEAKRLADEWMYKHFKKRVKTALTTNDHFAYEGHFRDKSPLQTPRKFKKRGYYLSLIFMGLPDPHQSELRVIDRAKHGGHNVPLYDIEFNFYGNLKMLNSNYKMFDEIVVVDTCKRMQHKILLHTRHFEILSYAPLKGLPLWFTKFLPRLAKLIISEEKKLQQL